ncbi:hypothetical protein HKD37_05G013460 [Glycine soja]
MNDNMTAMADQCIHDPSIERLMDATMSSSSEGMMMLRPTNSHNYTTSGHNLTPKGCAFKPIRRRSRTSKSTPITLLKANTSNFRALVQQFTGCPTTTTMSLAIHKGPITLNFQQDGTKQHIHHDQHHTKITTRGAMPPFATISSNQNHASVPFPKQQLMQEQQSGYFLPTYSGNSYRPISCVDDGLIFDNDFSLHELTVNAISNDSDGLFM